jgi:hypothetical protein
MATAIAIADAVVTALNAGGFAQPFTAVRLYRPQFELKDMGTLHVTVVPRGVVIQTASRGIDQHDYQIDVAVQKRLASEDAAEIDALMTLVEQIGDKFRRKVLETDPPAMWVKSEHAPIYAPEHLEQLRQFTSVVTLTFRAMRNV